MLHRYPKVVESYITHNGATEPGTLWVVCGWDKVSTREPTAPNHNDTHFPDVQYYISSADNSVESR